MRSSNTAMATPKHQWQVVAFVALALMGACPTASAEDDPRRKRADAPFQEGLRLHDKGKEEDALARFREAHAIYPSPNVLFQIARSEQLLHRNLDAIRDYREALRDAVLHPKNRELAPGYIAELEAKLSRVRVTGPAGAEVVVRGITLTLPHPEPIDVEPGEVILAARLGAVDYGARGLAARGSLLELELASTLNAAADAAPLAPHPERREAPLPSDRTRWIVGGALVGVGAIGAVVGGVLLASASSDQSRLDGLKVTDVSGTACRSGSSEACVERRDLEDDRVQKTNTGALLLVGSGALIVGGVVTFLVWPTRSASSSGVWVSPTANGAAVSGRF